MGSIYEALQVHVDDTSMIFDRDVPEKADCADADIVDPDIDATEFGNSFLGEASNLFRPAFAPCLPSSRAAPRPKPLDAPAITTTASVRLVGRLDMGSLPVEEGGRQNLPDIRR